MCRSKFVAGFTLIELLMVMAILSIATAIVLPLTVQSVEKARVYAERDKVELFIRKVGQDSFFLSQRLTLEFEGKQIQAKGVEYQKSMELEFLAFEAKTANIAPFLGVEPFSVGVSAESRLWEFKVEEKGQTVWDDPD